MSESATKAEHSHVNSTLFDIVERNSLRTVSFILFCLMATGSKFRNYQNYEEFNGARRAIMYADGFSQVVAVRPSLNRMLRQTGKRSFGRIYFMAFI